MSSNGGGVACGVKAKQILTRLPLLGAVTAAGAAHRGHSILHLSHSCFFFVQYLRGRAVLSAHLSLHLSKFTWCNHQVGGWDERGVKTD